MWWSQHHEHVLKTSAGHSQLLSQPVHVVSVVQHLAVDGLPHTKARQRKWEASSSYPLPPKWRFCFCCFFFRVSVNFRPNKQNSFVSQIGLSYKKKITLWISRGIFWKRQICSFWKENLLHSCSLFGERNAPTNCRQDPSIDFFHSREHETPRSARKTGTELLCAVQSS